MSWGNFHLPSHTETKHSLLASSSGWSINATNMFIVPLGRRYVIDVKPHHKGLQQRLRPANIPSYFSRLNQQTRELNLDKLPSYYENLKKSISAFVETKPAWQFNLESIVQCCEFHDNLTHQLALICSRTDKTNNLADFGSSNELLASQYRINS